MPKKLTHEEFVKRFNQKNPTILVTSIYINAAHPISFYCNVCGLDWTKKKAGNCCDHGCPICTKAGRKTHEQFVKEYNQKYPNVIVLSKYINARQLIKLRCNQCGREWSIVARDASGCRKCSYKFSHQQYLELLNDKDIKDVIPLEQYQGSETKILHKNLNCNHIYKVKPASVLARNQCAVCTNKIVYIGFNDVWTTNPDMAILLYNPDDGYKYTQGSNKKVNWKCQRCGHIIKNKSFANIKHNGLVCPICSDGISVPNKFIAALLDSLDIKFDREKQFDWNINRFYDFYLPENNVIIEVHGLQHYEECGFASKWNLHLKDVKENDKQKQLKAELNGINEYIIIDARYSEIDWLRNHVLTSKLINFYNLENVDWEMCFKKTCTSNLIEACKLHNLGKSDDEIIRTLKISKSGLYLLIRKGRKIKLCE